MFYYWDGGVFYTALVSKLSGVGINSGWDFESNSLSHTSVNIYRDLHCWEMMFNWIPTGFMKSYNLTIRVKAPALHDLKITKRKSHLDNY